MTIAHVADGERASVRAAISAFRTPSLARSLWQVANTFLPFFAVCGLMYWTLDSVPYWVTLLGAILAAGLVVRIFIIQHDCGHGSFFRGRRANTVLGLACSLITCTPYAAWRRQHAGHHAGWNDLDRRDLGVDIYSTCLTLAEYRALTRGRRIFYRLSRHPLVTQILLPPLVFLVLYRLPFDMPEGWRAERRAVQLTNLGLVALMATLGLSLGFFDVLRVQLPIMVVAAIVGVWLFSVQHRFEGVRWDRHETWNFMTASLEGSSLLKLPRALQWFTGNIGYHHIHHLDPRIPNYRLQQCHEANPMARGPTVLTLWSSLRATSHLLWDEERRQMVRLPTGRTA